MEALRVALEGVAAKLARARTVREAVTRAHAEAEAAAGKLDAARKALVTVEADRTSGAPVAPAALEALRADLAAAERDASLRGEVEAELRHRAEAFEGQLADARDELTRARDAAAAEAREASGAPTGTAASLANVLGVRFEADPASPEAEAGEEIRAATSALVEALSGIAESRRERFNAEQLAKRGGPRAA